MTLMQQINNDKFSKYTKLDRIMYLEP